MGLRTQLQLKRSLHCGHLRTVAGRPCRHVKPTLALHWRYIGGTLWLHCGKNAQSRRGVTEMAWCSFHGGHSGRYCLHAHGTLADVLQVAYARGFSHYGLSEHAPRYRTQDLFPEERHLTPEHLVHYFEQFVADARQLQVQWQGRMEVLVGMETERLPSDAWAEKMMGLRSALQLDYLVGSVHDVDGVCIDFSAEITDRLASDLGGKAQLQTRYFDAVADLVTTLRPEVVGHLDLIRKFDGPQPQIFPQAWPALQRALEAVEAAGSVLDVNAAPARRGMGPVYPLPEILNQARRMGIAVTLGDDSHAPQDVGSGLDACVNALVSAGYREVHYLTRLDGAVALARCPIDEMQPCLR